MADSTNAVASAALQMESRIEHVKDEFVKFAYAYGMQVIGAVIILIVGFMVSRWVGGALQRWLDRQELEPPVKTLFVRLARLLVLVFTLVMVLDKFGVPIAALVTSIGVAGVGIGLALQGVLGNLVAGLTIIFTKPFRVGEYIELAGVNGQVTHIDLFSTKLAHSDLSRVVIPNRKIIGEILHNFGAVRQLNLSVGVGYGTAPAAALAVINDILARNPRVLKKPAPVVGVSALADSAVNIAIAPWTSVADFGPAQAEIYQAILEEFRAKNIEIPFPQREVRLLNQG
jgi:small conductance mechanosensitive channel